MSDLAVTLDEYVVPNGWVLASFADLAITPKNDIVDGPFGSNLKASEYTDSGVPILRLQNIKRNYFLDKNIKFVTQEKYEQLIRHTYKTGDILITKLGDPLGVACIAPQSMGEGVIVADIVRVRLPVDQIDIKYITYLINSPLAIQQFKENTKGTTRQRVNLKFVRDLQLPIAPLEQQKLIVAKIEELFSHIDAGTDALNKAKQLLEQYRQSVLKAAVTGELTKEWREQNKGKQKYASQLLECILQERRQKWEEQQLEQFKAKGKMPKNDKWKERYKEPGVPGSEGLPDLPEEWCWSGFEQTSAFEPSAMKAGPFGSALKKEFYVEKGYKIYGQEQVINEDPYYGDYYIDEDRYQSLINCRVKPGDFLISLVGTIGRTLVLPDDIEPGIINPRLIKITFEKKLAYPEYMKIYVASPAAKQIFKLASHGGTMDVLNMGTLKALPLPLPPKEEQEVIVSMVDNRNAAIERQFEYIEKLLLLAEKNKQAILVSAFSGKLVESSFNESAEVLIERIMASAKAAKKTKKRVAAKPKEVRINNNLGLEQVIIKAFGEKKFSIEELLAIEKSFDENQLKDQLFKMIKNKPDTGFKLEMSFDENSEQYLFSLVEDDNL